MLQKIFIFQINADLLNFLYASRNPGKKSQLLNITQKYEAAKTVLSTLTIITNVC